MITEIERLNQLLTANWEGALDGDPVATRVCLHRIERLALMLGLEV